MFFDSFALKETDAKAVAEFARALGHRVRLKGFDKRDGRAQKFVVGLRALAEGVVDTDNWVEFNYGKGSVVVYWVESAKAPSPVARLTKV